MTPTTTLINTLKDNDQDFEYYPTTPDMISAVLKHIPADAASIMDIGAGTGKVLKSLSEKCTDAILYSIEKSAILAGEQDKNVIPVGADFHMQQLAALPVDYIFCNPPYSEYEEWTDKIIREGYARKAFLIIPSRWENSKIIKEALDSRGATARKIFNGDFLTAERAARAQVDILEIGYPLDKWSRDVEDPFNIWFDQNVGTFDQAEPIKSSYDQAEELARRFKNSNIAEMVASYREEYSRLEKHYRDIFTLDLAILRELNVDKEQVRDGLKKKMEGLKNKYWKMLFNRLDAITSRLATKPKEKLLAKLTGNAKVEFTQANAYAVVVWAIKNANQYFDDQLTDLFFELATKDGVKNYKSNLKTWEKDDWRYNSRTHDHFRLDYRFIVEKSTAIKNDKYYSYRYIGHLYEGCHELIADIIAVLSNLGFKSTSPNSLNREWEAGQAEEWYTTVNGEEVILFEVKAHKNGNMHFRFMPDAIKALNIEAARLLKWVRSPEEVTREMGYSKADAEKYYHSSAYILPSNIKFLESPKSQPAPEPEPEPEPEIEVITSAPESQAKIKLFRYCDNCGATLEDNDEILCPSCKPAPVMVPGEGAPQYTFTEPKNEQQLSLM